MPRCPAPPALVGEQSPDCDVTAPARAAPRAPVRLWFARAALHLGALWGLAVLQPLLGLLGENPEFFVARGSTPGDILALALGYGLVPPLVAAAVVAALGLVRPALGSWLLAALVVVLVTALVLPPIADALSGSATAVAVALAAGAGFAAAYRHARALRSLLTFLSPAPLVSIGLFLAVSPVSALVLPGDSARSPAGPSRSATPIVHVIFDELPVSTLSDGQGRIDGRHFPNLAQLAADATWYRNATSTADRTVEAVPAQLTGLLPRPGALPTARGHPRSLFTLFARSHEPLVVEPITEVCPQRVCDQRRPTAGARLRALGRDLAIVQQHLLLPSDLRERLPPIDGRWADFGAAAEGDTGFEPTQEANGDAARTFAGRVGRSRPHDGFAEVAEGLGRIRSRPPLVFVHSPLPHASWELLPDGRRYRRHRDEYPGGNRPLTRRQWVGDQAFQRHVLQMQLADAQVGRLLARLRETGLYDRAVIVVTADHGTSFRAGDVRRRPTPTNLADVAGVPFLVKSPGQRAGTVDDGAVRTVDVLPTIAKAAGVRVPWRTDGVAADERPTDLATPIVVSSEKTGTSVTQPLRTLVEQRRARDAHEAWVLRHGVYAVGPRPDLLGTWIADAAPAPTAARATVDGRADYAAIAPGARTLPALVSGAVTGLPAGALLAVAVNGRVEASTRVDRRDGRLEYQALVRPASLRVGSPNDIAILQVMHDRRLARIGGTPRRRWHPARDDWRPAKLRRASAAVPETVRRGR